MKEDVELDDNFEGEIIYPNLPGKKDFGEAVVMLKNVSKGTLLDCVILILTVKSTHWMDVRILL